MLDPVSVLVAGDPGVGKTSLINRFVTGHFSQPASSPASRPGSGAPHQKLHVAARRRTRFLISEASAPPGGGGSEARPVDAVLVCFRLDSSVSLARVVSSWSSLPATATTVLVGTMSDIRESPSTTYQQAQAIAKQIGAVSYVETSAKLSYSSAAAAFEAAALCTLPGQLTRPAAEARTLRPRDLSEPRLATGLNCLRPQHRGRGVSASSSSLCERTLSPSGSSGSSTLSSVSSTRSGASTVSVSTSRHTPLLTRRQQRDKQRETGEQMVTIRVETLNRDRQMEEVEIQVPVTVYRNMDPEQLPAPGPDTRHRGFVRSCGKRSSLAAKLRQLMLR